MDYKPTRHPTEKESKNPTDSPSLISCGKVGKKLLQILKDSKDRLNIKGFSRSSGIPRTTIIDNLNRLILKKLATKEEYGNYKITEQGKNALELLGGVGTSRKECRESGTLSQHFTRFELPIKSRVAFSELRLKELSPERTQELKIPNNNQHYAYFEGATIILTKKKVIIRIHDLIGQHQEELMLEAFSKAVDYAQRLKAIGIVTDEIKLERAHFARVESLLAEFLKKIDEKYFLELADGTKFWIDFSTGVIEDETDSPMARQRMDEFLNDALKSKALVSDIDKQKEVSANLIRYLLMKEKGLEAQFYEKIPKSQTTIDKYTEYIG